MSPHCVLLTPEAPPAVLGGIGRYVAEVAPRLAASMPVDVLHVPTYRGAGAVPAGAGADAYREALLAVGDVRRLEPLARAADGAADACAGRLGRLDGPAVVYVQDYALAPVAAALARRLRAAVVAACHLPVYAGFTYFDKPISDALHQVLEAQLVHLARRVVVPSRFTAEVLALTHNVGDKLAVVPLGACRATAPVPPPAAARLLAIGRPTEQKGWHLLLPAVEALGRRHAGLRATFVCGTAEHARLAALVAASGAADRVDLVGAVDHDAVWALHDAHTLLVTASLYETFGLSVLEAMASARPAVGFAVGALRELWGAALAADCGTPVARVGPLVERLLPLLDDSAALRELARRSRRRAAGFTWERHAGVLAALLREAAGGAGAARWPQR